MTTLRWKVKVTEVVWDEIAISAALATDSTISGAIMSKAVQAKEACKASVAAASTDPGLLQDFRATGIGPYGAGWLPYPNAVAELISNDPMGNPIETWTLRRGNPVPVALVVADHPNSVHYITAFRAGLTSVLSPGWHLQETG